MRDEKSRLDSLVAFARLEEVGLKDFSLRVGKRGNFFWVEMGEFILMVT